MSRELAISIGQHSDRGRKDKNQDFHGALIPSQPLLSQKGIAVALADGISSSEVSAIASEAAVKSFLTDYFCTSDSWSVKTSAQRVIAATNSWLHSQSRRSLHAGDKDRGYVCTLSVMVIKSTTAHLFHIGDARIYRVVGRSLEQLTQDHRIVISSQQSYLSRALGINPQIEIDYRAFSLTRGDLFVLATDGVYEHVGNRFIVEAVDCNSAQLDEAARAIVEEAKRLGSPDNLTVQIVRIEDLPHGDEDEVARDAADLPCPALLDAGMELDGYKIVRELHGSSRSHVYLATDPVDGTPVALKIPSIDCRDDPQYRQRFMMEEWVARRIKSGHVVTPRIPSNRRTHLYVVTEFVDGQTLSQWMVDNPAPSLQVVRGIVEQIAKGLQAFHRMEMLHQDLRPDNVMIDRRGTAKIIDFGAARIAGVADVSSTLHQSVFGTAQFTAPEYFLGESGSVGSDIFSLGVITYQMLSGRLPYGAQVARTKTRSQQRKLRYQSVRDDRREIPAWIDVTLAKAVHPDPAERYGELSEFMFDLRRPNESYLKSSRPPLMERDPLLAWKTISALLLITAVVLAALLIGAHR